MDYEIDDDYFRKKLTENRCWSIHLTYPNALVLDFGNKIEWDLGKYGKKNVGEWILYSEYCLWRVRQKNTILCNSYLLDSENEEIMKKIPLEKLIDLIHNENDDFIFVFNDDYVIEILCTIESENILTISNMGNNYCYSKNKKWHKDDFNESDKYDEIISIHANECYERWKQIIPEISDKNHCRNCIYYIPIRGDYNFHGYGICSNKESDYDGKLVYAKSNCELNLKNRSK